MSNAILLARLRSLANPLSEGMADGARLTLLVHAALDAADEIDRLAAALAAEREECAKVAEEISPLTAGKVIAAAIRARGQE